MNSESLKQSVNDIISTRQPLVKRIENLRGILQELERLLQETRVYGTQENAKLTDEQKKRVQGLPIEKLLEKSKFIRDSLTTLQARFSRGTLNIGVIGRARQGKSRLLQSLTGLSRREIPDANGMHCTGVRSTICHQAGVDAYAEVYFYSETEFLQQVIEPYFNQLQLGSRPLSLDEFSGISLRDASDGAVARAKLEHLKKYQECLDKYRDWLKSSSPIRITKEEIPKFITQYDPDDPSAPFFNYLAVKEVRIFCPFPDENVGKVAVVDMPGLGDTGIGDENRMVSTLGQDIDLILFVRMPKSTGDYWADVDVQLYDIANRALQGTSLESWAFQVLNRLEDGTNEKNCRDLQDTIKVHHLRMAQVITINCANSQEVQTKLLLPALQHLGTHIGTLDQRFMQASEEQLAELRRQLTEFAQDAGQAISASGGSNEYRIFENLFQDFWKEKLRLGLFALRAELWEIRQEKDLNLESALNEAIQNAKHNTGIPDIEQIRKRAKQEDSLPTAYYNLLDIVRVTLSENFQSQLDKSLQASIDAVKMRVVKIFCESGLDSLTNQDGLDFFEVILDLLEKDPDRMTDKGLQKLYQGFKELMEFRLLYRGLVQPRIRQHLDSLTAPREGIRGSQCAPEPGNDPTVEVFFEMLQGLHAEALYNIEAELKKLLWEPSMAAFAVVEEFLDSVTKSEGVESSWKKFLWSYREKIWHQEFRWQYLVSRLQEFAKPGCLSMVSSN